MLKKIQMKETDVISPVEFLKNIYVPFLIDQEKWQLYVSGFYHEQTDRLQQKWEGARKCRTGKKLPARSQFILNKRFTGELVQSRETVVEEP